MKISQTYPAALIATHTNDSAPQKPKSARRGLMQRLGFAFLACALAIGATGTGNAGSARDEGAVRGLGDAFANAFVQKNAELRASLFAEDGTFVTPQGDFLQGRVAMVKDFGPEAEQAVNGTTQAAFSNYRVRFIKPAPRQIAIGGETGSPLFAESEPSVARKCRIGAEIHLRSIRATVRRPSRRFVYPSQARSRY